MSRNLKLGLVGLVALSVELAVLVPAVRGALDRAEASIRRTGVPFKLGDGERWQEERLGGFGAGVLPTVVADRSGSYAYARAASGQLLERRRRHGAEVTDWSAAKATGLVARSAPAALLLPGAVDRMLVFRGEDGFLNFAEHAAGPGGTWRAAVSLATMVPGIEPMIPDADPAIVALDEARADVMVLYRGAHDELVVAMREAGSWSVMHRFEARLKGTPAAVVMSDREIQIFYRELHDRLYVMAWQRMRHEFKVPEGGGDTVYVGCSPAVAFSPDNGELVGYYCGANGHLWFTHYPDRPGGPWGSAPHDTGLTATAASVSLGDGPEFYFTDAEQRLHVDHPTGGFLRSLVTAYPRSQTWGRWITGIHVWPTFAPTALELSNALPCACQRE